MVAQDALSALRSALADRYAVERELGRGGMATVYLAHDIKHGRQVALKVLRPTLGHIAGDQRFLREIQLTARLQHPHILPLHDSGELDGALYYVMPFVEGESLRDRLKRERRMAVEQALRIAREVAGALAYAHARGIVHRDIKPENILLSDGHAVVADFGIARAVSAAGGDSLTMTGAVVGTLAYASPEQLLGDRDVDGRSDVYSLGCVLYEMLAGEPPFAGRDGSVETWRRFTEGPPSVHTLRPDVPTPVEEALRKALGRWPEERFPTVDEFAEALSAGATEPSVGMPRLPTSASLQQPPRLPVPLTSFIGREREVQTVLTLLQRESVRLLTLHGPGGVGKTRLALEVAAQSAPLFPEGVYFVALTEARDVDTLRARVAHAAGLRGGAAGSPDALRDHLRGRRALLVLDNFEQLVDVAPELSGLLADSPSLKALVTSQVILRVYGEHEVPVEPLDVPAPHHAPRASTAMQSSAVRLFVDRAVAARPDFRLDDENAPAVVEICSRLDGVPLAIELAAARVKTAPPQALLPKLRRALDVLTGGARDLPARQRTMRGAIAWCHDLLTPEERALFRRLAVFAGGATADAAAAVCASAEGGGAVEDALASLADHSLVRHRSDPSGDARYLMLRPIHVFATEALDAAGEHDDAADRHAAFFSALAREAEPHVMRGDEDWFDRLEAEHDNLRATLDRLTARGEIDDALGMAVALWRFWDARSYAREGLDRLRGLLDAAAGVPVKLHLAALYAAGVLADTCCEYALGRRLFENHVALTAELGDPRATAVASNNLAILLLRQGDIDGAIPLFEMAVTSVREVGNLQAAGLGTANIGNAERQRRNFAAARARYEEALRIFTEIGDRVNVAWSLSHLGDLARDEGDGAAAEERYRESLAKFATLQHRRGMGVVLTDLGELALAAGNLEEARARLEEALINVAEVGDQRAMIRVFEALAGAAAAGGAAERALRLAGAVAGLRDRLGASLSAAERDRLERRVMPAIERLPADAGESAWREGTAMSMDEVVRYATAPD